MKEVIAMTPEKPNLHEVVARVIEQELSFAALEEILRGDIPREDLPTEEDFLENTDYVQRHLMIVVTACAQHYQECLLKLEGKSFDFERNKEIVRKIQETIGFMQLALA